MLYSFSELDKKLNDLGFPIIHGPSGFRIIKGVDFEEAFKSGSISFEDDGIYLEYDGKKYMGYMFIQEAYITYNGGPVKFPKFHVLKCRTIQEFISSGRFKQRYEFSNYNVNDLVDKQTRTKYDNVKLEICSYCKSDYFDEINDTQDFYDLLDKSDIEKNKIEVDIFGYVRDWPNISRDYKESQNYTCENCSIQPNGKINHKRWWHVHHINNEKTINDDYNLKCLCILCHANVDSHHKENFSKGTWPKQIDEFKKEYLSELKRLNNPYL
jgi:hypothetical protein